MKQQKVKKIHEPVPLNGLYQSQFYIALDTGAFLCKVFLTR
jgi:hypothetical protein